MFPPDDGDGVGIVVGEPAEDGQGRQQVPPADGVQRPVPDRLGGEGDGGVGPPAMIA